MQKLIGWRENIIKVFNNFSHFIKYAYGFAKFLWRRWFPHLKKFHLNVFPSMRLKGFNRIDLALKFSPEILLLLFAVGIALWNFNYFYNSKELTDQSHAAKLLSAKQNLNPRLYAKISEISTVVLSNGSIIVPEAQAEEFVSINEASYDETLADSLIINNDTIIQPNPDSVQLLLSKQIKVYQTQSNDTLQKIAADNGLSTQTLMWANKLTSQTIKPGWFLIILPTNGILHKASSNDTLPDIAHKYNREKFNSNVQIRENAAEKLLENIISYNGLAGAEDINEGDVFIIPGGVIPSPPAAPKPSADGKVKPQGAVIPNLGNGTGHIFPKGYCTWYVASRVHVPWGGNAKAWLQNAKALGRTITKNASVGSIVVTTDQPKYGHVAFVESVTEKGFTVSEMNYEKFGKVNTRFIPHTSKTIRGFIIP